MKIRTLSTTLGIIALALFPVASSADVEGNGGACLVTLAQQVPVEGLPEVAFVCTEDFDEADCLDFCGETKATEGGLQIIECEYLTGIDCQDIADEGGFDWEGACLFEGPGINLCFETYSNIPGLDGEGVCEDGDGMWQGDGSSCGAPVPTLPKMAQGALMVILLLGALVILNLSGILRSA